jgi:SAM-dependent methyltransferase
MRGFARATGRRLACFVRAQPSPNVAASSRPYYGEYAWAYDLLTDRPSAQECECIGKWLAEFGIHAGASVLDAGCGTGRYARHLAEAGFRVTGIDSSLAMLGEARKHCGGAEHEVALHVDSILAHSSSLPYDAVLCRGVLNDLTDTLDRGAAFTSFAQMLRPGGVLILDVREWTATFTKYTRKPIVEKRVVTDRGALSFRCTAQLDPSQHLLCLAERHTITTTSQETVSDFNFVMRCWTRGELSTFLFDAGFVLQKYFGAFDATVAVGSTDRLVAVAMRGVAP